MSAEYLKSVQRQASRYRDGSLSAEAVPVIREVPLTIFYNRTEVITLLTTPEHPVELALGFLKSEGFINTAADVLNLDADEEHGTVRIEGRADAQLLSKLMEKRTITSGCGKGTTFYHAVDALTARPSPGGFNVSLEKVLELVSRVNKDAAEAREAGGVHHAALASADGVTVIREDIGRHNAIDKIQGHCLVAGIATADKFLISTGRISSEIVIKASKMGVPMLVSLSKPSSLALDLADRLQLTVVGNARGRQAVVYADFGRLGES